MNRLVDRFLRYVKIDTQSDPYSETVPSTLKQKDLSNLLVKELKEIGVDGFIDEKGYVYAHLKNNTGKDVKPIGFVAHVDTSPDAPGANVNPKIIKKYDGSDIKLNENITMNSLNSPALKRVIGEDIIVTDGNTLLGADDKAGVAEIMELVNVIVEKKLKHGDIFICFTPDEEIGRGADHFNHEFFKADFAYTLDGSEVGEIEYENFNAASASLTFIGKSIHPGSAKLQMINSMHLAIEFHQMLPVFLNPAYTDEYEGFNHLSEINGEVEKTTANYIIRNHSKEKFNEQKETFKEIANYLNKKYGYNAVELKITDSYYNMYDVIKDHMYIVELAEEAIRNNDIEPISRPIRGGTDGARLTFDGLPCPNLGTGGYNFHGRMEFASINQMEKALDIALEIVKIVSEK
ncbi:peptidase T [Haploplasma axanthum]|uniref:Peptidase T n=1 Tax=Haploplasma axanthum TaxID=29552 RepID=A0A449BF01_HAPAX|nr:peptidase T [Haploplasma axanthum]VEU81029.1 Peptidase T [Haploplasma axanthum]